VQVVGEHRRRSDEYAVGQARRFIDEGIILDFAVVAQPDGGPYIGSPADVPVTAQEGDLPD
jgi:hypothetical protein